MPPKTKATACGAPRKDAFGKPTTCTQVKRSLYPNGPILCPERDQHVSPIKTGTCHAGFCEGKKVVQNGRNMKTCDKWATCPCECHTALDQMFILSEQPRTLIDSSGYVPIKSPYVMPSLADRAILSVSTPTVAPVRVESVAPGVVPATIARTFAATASGRAAKGELESWVMRVCTEWLVDKENGLCTPSYISAEIGDNEGIKPPSTGAVTACLDRWQAIGFANVMRKPVRFIAFTEEGIEHGLEGMKLKAKQKKGKV